MTDSEQVGTPDAAQEAVLHFADELAKLRELHGSLSFERMGNAVRHTGQAAGSKNTFHRMVNRPNRIYEPEFVRGFVLALGLSDGEADAWERRRIEALQKYQLARDTALISASTHNPVEQPPSSRNKYIIAVIILICAAVASTIVALADRGRPTMPPVNSQISPRDGADPKESGCALDPEVKTLDSTEVDFQGKPVGLDELRYSPMCGSAWARFTPFPKAKISSNAIIYLDTVRPDSNNLEMPFDAHYAGAAVYGNLLRSTAACVYAATTIKVGGEGLPESRTACFHGETPVDNEVSKP